MTNTKELSVNKIKTKKVVTFAMVVLSQIFVFLAGILSSFLLPKLFSVSGYGYIKTFTLYFAYLGFAHFGFVDGLHILLSNKRYEEFDKEYIRKLTRIYSLFELSLSIVSGVVVAVVLGGSTRIVFLVLALSLFTYNIYGYAQQLAIASSRFNLVTICNFIDAIFKLLTILLIWLFSKYFDVHFVFYILTFALQYLVMAIVLISSMKECFFGKAKSDSVNKKEIFFIIKTGVPLLIANLLATFVSSCVSVFVQIAYPVELFDTYSIYSFAISMSTVISPIVTAVSVILFPTIRKISKEKAIGLYDKMFSTLCVLAAFALLFYPIILFAFEKVVPNYKTAFQYFGILFPGILISSVVVCVNLNYFKLLNKIWHFNLISICTATLIIVVTVIFYFAKLKFIPDDSILIYYSIFGLLCRLIWFVSTSLFIQRVMKKNLYINYLYVLGCFGFFYLLCNIGHLTTLGFMFFYILIFAMLTVSIFYKETKYVFWTSFNKAKNIYRRFQK